MITLISLGDGPHNYKSFLYMMDDTINNSICVGIGRKENILILSRPIGIYILNLKKNQHFNVINDDHDSSIFMKEIVENQYQSVLDINKKTLEDFIKPFMNNSNENSEILVWDECGSKKLYGDNKFFSTHCVDTLKIILVNNAIGLNKVTQPVDNEITIHSFLESLYIRPMFGSQFWNFRQFNNKNIRIYLLNSIKTGKNDNDQISNILGSKLFFINLIFADCFRITTPSDDDCVDLNFTFSLLTVLLNFKNKFEFEFAQYVDLKVCEIINLCHRHTIKNINNSSLQINNEKLNNKTKFYFDQLLSSSFKHILDESDEICFKYKIQTTTTTFVLPLYNLPFCNICEFNFEIFTFDKNDDLIVLDQIVSVLNIQTILKEFVCFSNTINKINFSSMTCSNYSNIYLTIYIDEAEEKIVNVPQEIYIRVSNFNNIEQCRIYDKQNYDENCWSTELICAINKDCELNCTNYCPICVKCDQIVFVFSTIEIFLLSSTHIVSIFNFSYSLLFDLFEFNSTQELVIIRLTNNKNFINSNNSNIIDITIDNKNDVNEQFKQCLVEHIKSTYLFFYNVNVEKIMDIFAEIKTKHLQETIADLKNDLFNLIFDYDNNNLYEVVWKVENILLLFHVLMNINNVNFDITTKKFYKIKLNKNKIVYSSPYAWLKELSINYSIFSLEIINFFKSKLKFSSFLDQKMFSQEFNDFNQIVQQNNDNNKLSKKINFNTKDANNEKFWRKILNITNSTTTNHQNIKKNKKKKITTGEANSD